VRDPFSRGRCYFSFSRADYKPAESAACRFRDSAAEYLPVRRTRVNRAEKLAVCEISDRGICRSSLDRWSSQHLAASSHPPVFVSLQRRRVRAFTARDAFRGTHVRLIVTCETARTRLRTRVAHPALLGWRRDARLTSRRRAARRRFDSVA